MKIVKRIWILFVIIILLINCNVFADNNSQLIYTQKTDIYCIIDNLFIESYLINGFTYLPLNKLVDYGFDIKNEGNQIVLDRKKIFYFDGDYSSSSADNSNLLVSENTIPVMIRGNKANTYLVDGEIVIQADELNVFGDFVWIDNGRKIAISIVRNELINAFENATDLVEENNGYYRIGQQDNNGVWNGIVKTSYFNGPTYLGYMIDGVYEGVVLGYRKHKPYLAEMTELETMKNGKKNGYCEYYLGYNNKAESAGTTKSSYGMYVDNELKNGEYTIYSDYSCNTTTYSVTNYEKHIIHSTHNYKHEKTDANILYNGKKVEFDVQPVSEKDRILIPLRGLFEKMGALVEWKNDDRSIKVIMNDKTICIKIDSHVAMINNNTKYMDVPPRLVNDKTMIPLRFLSEELDFKVEWDEESRTAKISK